MHASHLHTKPSVTGEIARNANCGRLVLTHFKPEIEEDLDAAVRTVREQYKGEVQLAFDLMTIHVDGSSTT